MGKNSKKVLHNFDGLEITFLVLDGVARIDFRSDGSVHRLDDVDDVIVFVDGRNIEVESSGGQEATATVGPWEDDAGPRSLMIRVGEFFEGWELS